MLAGAAAAWLKRRGPPGFRGRLWRTVFLVLAIAGLTGAIAHGVVLGEDVYIGMWRALYFALALLVASFFLATVRDLAGDVPARRALPVVLVVALAFFAYSQIEPDNFRPFVWYESAAMTLSLAGYVWIAIRGTQPGAAWIVAAIVTNIAAAAIQATRAFGFTPVWTFDHNGVFHLVQMAGVLLLVRGLRAEIRRGPHPRPRR
jgi:hypothetical protein